MSAKATAILLAAALLMPPGSGAAQEDGDGHYTRLDLQFECPSSATVGEPIMIRSFSANLEREVPVQTLEMMFPDEIRSFGVQASNGDEIHLFHRLLEPLKKPRTVPSNYGRYDLPLTVPFAQVVHRPSMPGRPLTLDVLFRPAKAGMFRIYFKTATRSQDGTYDYYPKSGLTGPYDEFVEVCRFAVTEADSP